MKQLAILVVLLAPGCGGDNEGDGGDPAALADCLDGCDADKQLCDDDCAENAQLQCQDECPALSTNCSSGFCTEYTSGTPRRLQCENACTRYEGSCFMTCPQAGSCLVDCDDELTGCVASTCAQFAADTDERAACAETCIDTAGSCVESCAVDDSCEADCGDVLGDCNDGCQQSFGPT